MTLIEFHGWVEFEKTGGKFASKATLGDYVAEELETALANLYFDDGESQYEVGESDIQIDEPASKKKALK